MKEPKYHIRASLKIFKKKNFKTYQGKWLSDKKKNRQWEAEEEEEGLKKKGEKEKIRATVQRGKMLRYV